MSIRLRLGSAAVLVALAAAGAPPATAASTLPWLHVAHRRGQLPVIADAAGRTVLLRGANASGFEDDWYRDRNPDGTQKVAPFWPIDVNAYKGGRCPANSHVMSQPALCESDVIEMRTLGFNMMRLTLSWSALESTPGHYDRAYLDRIEQVVSWAAAQHIYVLLDMHQDNYSRFIAPTSPVDAPPLLTSTPGSGNHAAGAPPWAIVTDGEPSTALAGQDFTNAQMEAAWTSFWLNRRVAVPQGEAPGPGLQDHYIGAMAAVARRVRNNPVVAGYEIMNEPLPGFVQEPAFSATLLYPFYRRVIAGVPDRRHLFFFEPMALRNLLDAAPQLSTPFTSYRNIVYAPHVYTHVFTVDASVPNASALPYPLSYDQAFRTATLEARAMRAALFIGEYGNGALSDDTRLAPETAALDRHRAGGAVWHWKANCDPGTGPAGCPDSWGMFYGDPAASPAHNLGIKPTRRKYLSRAFPRATAGDLVDMAFDPDSGGFAMTARASRRVPSGATDRETVVFIPAAVTDEPWVAGRATIDRIDAVPGGGRLLYVAPTGRGMYTVGVSPRTDNQ
ncbi:MAG TPA: cellulase family glycosylhydrolase [Acidimicrobiales bacterium]|nr:cellulase family glycosylhydrolase [Acidimicrobiales bacterium]